MSPELREVLLKQREAFIQKFGRKPGPTESCSLTRMLMILSLWMPTR